MSILRISLALIWCITFGHTHDLYGHDFSSFSTQRSPTYHITAPSTHWYEQQRNTSLSGGFLSHCLAGAAIVLGARCASSHAKREMDHPQKPVEQPGVPLVMQPYDFPDEVLYQLFFESLERKKIRYLSAAANSRLGTSLVKRLAQEYEDASLAYFAGDKRTQKRHEAVELLGKGDCNDHCASHELSHDAQKLLQKVYVNHARYAQFHGNILQTTLYQESVAIIEGAAALTQDPDCTNIRWVSDIVATVNDAGFDFNVIGRCDRAMAVNDWCFALLETTQSACVGACEGIH